MRMNEMTEVSPSFNIVNIETNAGVAWVHEFLTWPPDHKFHSGTKWGYFKTTTDKENFTRKLRILNLLISCGLNIMWACKQDYIRRQS
jgi:hypothetical protein